MRGVLHMKYYEDNINFNNHIEFSKKKIKIKELPKITHKKNLVMKVKKYRI